MPQAPHITKKTRRSLDHGRTEAASRASADEVRLRLTRHTLTFAALAALLDINAHLVGCWLLRPTSTAWEPIPPARLEQIRAFLPVDAPMRPEIRAQLGWSPLRQVAYLASWTQGIPALTAPRLRAWRREAGVTQTALARQLAVSTQTIRNWERGTGIPRWQQWCLWWIIEHSSQYS